MKKNLIRFALLSCVTIFTFSSCKKDKDDNLAVTTENLIGSYKLADVKQSINGSPDVSTMSTLDDCDKDNVLQLKANNELVVIDQGLKCDGDETSTWKLENQKLVIGLNYFVSPDNYDVVTFTKSQLVIVATHNGGELKSKVTITLTRQ